MTTHDNTNTDEQYTTDDTDSTEAGSSTRGGLSVPMLPRHGPRPAHLT
jgi:hypothetical protein